MRFLREFTMQTYRTIQQQFLISFFLSQENGSNQTFLSFHLSRGKVHLRSGNDLKVEVNL